MLFFLPTPILTADNFVYCVQASPFNLLRQKQQEGGIPRGLTLSIDSPIGRRFFCCGVCFCGWVCLFRFFVSQAALVLLFGSFPDCVLLLRTAFGLPIITDG